MPPREVPKTLAEAKVYYTQRIEIPNAEDMNTKRSPLKQRTVLRIFGKPRNVVTDDCLPVTNPKLAKRIVTRSIGPFRVTGHIRAVRSLTAIMAEVKAEKPLLYQLLGSAGMLCCRWVRNAPGTYSNHAFGFAIDFKINGILDSVDDDFCQRGLIELYKIFKRHGWFWGAEFSREDSMHFEVSDELMQEWEHEQPLAA
jgi:hypothetical protein